MQLSPEQKKIIMFGAPVVAVFALISVLRGGGNPQSAPAPAVASMAPAASTNVVGVGQLAEFESMLTGAITQLGTRVDQQNDAIRSIPAPTTIIQEAKRAVLPVLDSTHFPTIAPQGTDMAVMGTVGGGSYNARHIEGGAPIYALIGDRWVQNFGRPEDLATGTPLATLSTFEEYVH